jgi:hypothetical protein
MPRSANGVAHLEKLELVEVPVMSVERLDTMLPQEGHEMGIRHQVAARGGRVRSPRDKSPRSHPPPPDTVREAGPKV